MKMNKYWVVWGIALAACSHANANDGDAGMGTCTVTMLSPYDSTRTCVEGPALQPDVCIAQPMTKSLYDMCAVAPDGVMYLGAVSSMSAKVSANGWTFGPRYLADALLVTPLSSSDEQTCAAVVPRATRVACDP